jgi:arsenate reductase
LSWLKESGLEYTVIDITVDPPSLPTLAKAKEQFGDRRPLFNTSGQSYGVLGAAGVKAMTDDDALDALVAAGRLNKRPFVVAPDGQVLVGFKEEVWQAQLKG